MSMVLGRGKKLGMSLLIIIAIGMLGVVDSAMYRYDTEGEDIYYAWVEGRRILSGENPYERILSGDMRVNDKYATYFPLFYLLSSATQAVGLDDYSRWVSFWRPVFSACKITIAVLILHLVHGRKGPLLSIAAALLWLFNRWTLYVSAVSHLDFLPILLLLLSLMLFRKHRWVSLLLFSLSLALKQIAIFLIPLYLIWIWQSSDQNRVGRVLAAAAAIASIPTLASLPFIAWNAEGFVKSMLFSVTRYPEGHFVTLSVDRLLGWVGIPGRLPMLSLIAVVCMGVTRRRIGMYASVLLTMLIFVGFNPVLFQQYMCWVVPFIPLSVCDMTQVTQLVPPEPGASDRGLLA